MRIAIGDRTYSSWSMRGHLLTEIADAPCATRHALMWSDDFEALKSEFAPARTVPALRMDNGALAWDSLAIAETLNDAFPEAGYWPADPAARAAARSMAAEMHSGFFALRGDCPMNLARRYHGFAPSDAVRADMARMLDLWRHARDRWGGDGPWLFGAKMAAVDAFFAPALARIVTYQLSDDPLALAYAETLYALPAFRRWRAMGLACRQRHAAYEMDDLPEAPRFGPAPLPAKAVTGATAINALCPYSQKPVTGDSLAEIDGRVVGFCNRVCRDKSVADAAAWPALMDLLAAA